MRPSIRLVSSGLSNTYGLGTQSSCSLALSWELLRVQDSILSVVTQPVPCLLGKFS